MAFLDLPVRTVAKRNILRNARLGTRPAPVQPNHADAFAVVNSARALKDAYDASTNPFIVALRTAWLARH
jgi:hypothetical protein